MAQVVRLATSHLLRTGGSSGCLSQHSTPDGNFLWINAIFLNEAAMVTQDILVVVYPFTGPGRHVRIVGRHKAYRLRDEMVATGAVTHIHIKGSGSRTFFLIPIDVKTMHAMATEEQLLDRRRIAMEVDNYRTVCRK